MSKSNYWKNIAFPNDVVDLRSVGTDGIIIPQGTTAERPVAPINGTMRFNTTTQHTETYIDGTGWVGDDSSTHVAQTAANAAQTATNAAATAADAAQTAADAVSTGISEGNAAISAVRSQLWAESVNPPDNDSESKSAKTWASITAADRVQTGLDRVQTGLDRVQTGLDRIATAADKDASEAARDVAVASVVGYATRDLFKVAISGGLVVSDGTIKSAGGLLYMAQSGATIIPDIAGWVPFNVAESKHFGAVCDGVTNDDAAIAALSAWFNLGNPIKLSGGGLSLVTTGLTPTTSGSITAGPGGGLKGAYGHGILITKPFDTPDIDWLSVDGVILEGDWGGVDHTDAAKMNDSGNHLCVVYGIENFDFSNNECRWGRKFACAARDVVNVMSNGNYIHHMARDGLNFNDCYNVQANYNKFHDLDDDVIAVGSFESGTVYGQAQIAEIVGNTGYVCQGIKAVAAQTITISGNVFDRFVSNGILAGLGDGISHSATSFKTATITGNTFTNGFDRSQIDGLAGTVAYCTIQSYSPQTGALTGIPGETDGTSVIPYHENAQNYGASAAIPAGRNVVISGNTFAVTLPYTANYSDLGYGDLWNRSGWKDPVVNAALLYTGSFGPRLMNINNAVINSNVVDGMAYAISFTGDYARGIVVNGNTLSGFYGVGGIVCSTAATMSLDVHVSNNLMDGDPFLLSSGRSGVNGGWADAGAGGAFRWFGGGLYTSNNTIKNVPRVTDGYEGSQIHRGNRLFCDPVATGYSASNKGIGNCPVAGEAWGYVIFGSDPQSPSTFRRVINLCPDTTTSKPVSGTYVEGQFVRKSTFGLTTGEVVLGWGRLTTGSGHVAETDWRVVKSAVLAPSESSANLALLSATINTTDKYAGKIVWDTTFSREVRAGGSAASSVWHVVDGSATITPV